MLLAAVQLIFLLVGVQSIHAFSSCSINCYRFANPAEATGGLEEGSSVPWWLSKECSEILRQFVVGLWGPNELFGIF